jgi:hypothetical protein
LIFRIPSAKSPPKLAIEDLKFAIFGGRGVNDDVFGGVMGMVN